VRITNIRAVLTALNKEMNKLLNNPLGLLGGWLR
jgi:hypothetical protein